MLIKDRLLEDLLHDCLDDDPLATRHEALKRARELRFHLLDMDADWKESQQRFYDDGRLIFYGAGTNVTSRKEAEL